MSGTRRLFGRPATIASFVTLLITSYGFGQANPPAPAKPTTPPATQPATPPATPPATEKGTPPQGAKSLDDVLGIPSAKTGGKSNGQSRGETSGAGSELPASDDAAPALDKARDRVEDALDEKAVDDLLRQALGGMRVSADRLARETDSGLGTQRVQQDVIAKLDTLIEEAKKRCKGGSCSSSGSCDKQGDKQGQQQGKKSGGKEGEKSAKKPGQSKSRKEPGKNDGTADGMTAGAEPPAVDPTDETKLLDESQTEWGMLPERVRDLIRQGSRDRVASIYQRLTEEYYRRMAEDASR